MLLTPNKNLNKGNEVARMTYCTCNKKSPKQRPKTWQENYYMHTVHKTDRH